MISDSSLRIGIMGGTFDPIHFGHLFIAEEARDRFGLDKVVFIPNGTPPHKLNLAMASADHRMSMTRLAIASNPCFVSSDAEMKRSPAYAVDTLKQLAEEFPGASLVYILGIDAAEEIETWRSPERVLSMANFVVASRSGQNETDIRKRLPVRFIDRFDVMNTQRLEISSTDIRNRRREGRSLRYLTPDPVIEYIEENRLYLP